MPSVVPNGPEIKRRRELAGLTQQGLSDQIRELPGKPSLSKHQIERIEAGQGTTRRSLTLIAIVLGVPVELLIGGRVPRPLIWAIGSYCEIDEEEAGLAQFLVASLAIKLVVEDMRLVTGESKMLLDLAHCYRDALPANSLVPCCVVLVGRLRGVDLQALFISAIGAVPSVAILLGGNAEYGRVHQECEAAAMANIPLISVPATGGAAASIATTAILDASTTAEIAKTRRTVDRGKLAEAIMAAVRQVTTPHM